MGWADQYIKVLEEKGEVSFNPKGNSMRPLIESGDKVTVRTTIPLMYRIGDIVLCKVKGKQYLHLISAIDEGERRFQISNNRGHVNGWISSKAIYGICIQVRDTVLLTKEEKNNRWLNSKVDFELPDVLAGNMTLDYADWLRKPDGEDNND